MVSPFTLGLFAPLPLAMMIPFMATQSLAMGEAFGKSFQYGKRKISSLTNEEFNKLTFNDLMDQQTANIRSIIPTLHTQMIDSNQMQQDIFREMTKLIPAFIEGLTSGTKDIFTQPPPTIIPTQETANQINQNNNNASNAIADFFKSLTNPIPSAYGSNEGSTTGTTLTNYGITENLPPSNIPITLSSLSYKEIQNLYSDMLSNRGASVNYTAKQKQELTLAFKAGKDRTPPPPETFTSIPDPQDPAMAKYFNAKTVLLIEGVKLFTKLTEARTLQSRNPSSYNKFQQENLLKHVQTWTRKIKNFITLARNVTATKASANADWNKRIWTTIG